MKIIADLHLHSHFSRATSKNLTFEHLTRWAQLKGVNVVGTGDIAHPGWLAEMREKLIPAEGGLYRLKDEYADDVQRTVPPACHAPVRFVLGGEISNIYKKGDRTRKVHNVVFAPSLDAVARLQARLEKIGNIRSDGRPILGLDSRDLLETLLEVDPACQLIPAHIWTPWFSLLGSKSGFDSVAECFGDLTPHIFALETGLSSDPPMNWRVSQLDRYTLVSNSDAHSPERLAREATLFDTELSYKALFDAMRIGEPGGLLGTVEFFPEEGKYHLDGHRSCGVVWEPPITIAHGGICPVCGKEVTIGVMHRVEELADRPVGGRPQRVRPYYSVIPLTEVIGQALGVGASSGRVGLEYEKLLGRLGPELFVLRDVDLKDIAAVGGERLAQGIERMRRGEVDAQGGYDGEYGVIRLFTVRGGGTLAASSQIGLFGETEEAPPLSPQPGPLAEDEPDTPVGFRGGVHRTASLVTPPLHDLAQSSFFDLDGALEPELPHAKLGGFTVPVAALLGGLNEAQREAIRCIDRSLIISAGPGTGKTRTLTHRIAYLVLNHHVPPSSILAITFTNKASEEMGERLTALLGLRSGQITVKTFHAFAAALLREFGSQIGLDPAFVICTENDRAVLLRLACPGLSQTEVQAALAHISEAKNQSLSDDETLSLSDDGTLSLSDDGTLLLDPARRDVRRPPEGFVQIYAAYQAALTDGHALDFDDLIFQAVRLLETCEDVLAAVHARYRWISVDEYQDVNAVQVRFLRLLAKGGANLCVIGDPDQAIYGFRGADRNYFLSFLADCPQSTCLRLTENYRSTQVILDAALQVIGAETAASTGTPESVRQLRAVQALADFAEQVKLDVYHAPTDRAEAEYTVHQIEQMIGGTSYFSLDSGRAPGDALSVGRSFADFAVLYRLSAQSRLVIEAFERSGIPFQTVGQTPLTEYADVRAVLAVLWSAHNPRSRLHLLVASQHTHQDKVLALLASLAELDPRPPVVRFIERIAQALGVGRDGAGAARLEQLARLAGPFGDRLGDFLEAMALHKETDAYDPRADRVTLMTLHAAKGLEFPVVFIVGCEEGLLPYVRKDQAPDVDEERRLFYVGMTRAQQKLVLCHARKRVLFGQMMENAPSRFVADIESALMTVQETQPRRTGRKSESPQICLF